MRPGWNDASWCPPPPPRDHDGVDVDADIDIDIGAVVGGGERDDRPATRFPLLLFEREDDPFEVEEDVGGGGGWGNLIH